VKKKGEVCAASEKYREESMDGILGGVLYKQNAVIVVFAIEGACMEEFWSIVTNGRKFHKHVEKQLLMDF